MLIALLATPAFAGLVTDPLGVNGDQPVNPAGIESDPMGANGDQPVNPAGIESDPMGVNGGQPVNSAGLISDPLGATGNPPAIVTGTAPGGAPHVCDAGDNCPDVSHGNITGGNGQDPIHPGAPEIAPAPSITGGNGQDPVGPQGVPQAGQQPLIAPQIVHLDGGCDDDQICGGMDDDQLIGWDDEALQPASSQTPPALNVFFGPIADVEYIAEGTPVQATCDADGDGFADNDCDGM